MEAMTALLASLSAVGTHVFSQATNVVNFITSTPLALLGVGLMIAGAVIGFVRRMITVA